jgi:hypothetical protein
MSPVRYELEFYIPEDGILHSHRRESLKSCKKFSPTNLHLFWGPPIVTRDDYWGFSQDHSDRDVKVIFPLILR